MGIRGIVVDTAGTTTYLSFINDMLFPYSAKALPDFLKENEHNVLVENCIEISPLNQALLLSVLPRWVAEDRKATPLKIIQGLI